LPSTFRLFSRSDATLSFAGLYELWPDPAKNPDDPDRWLWSAAIITHHATWLAGVMNDRTPVILPPDRVDAWLDPDLTDKDPAQKLISGIEYEPLQVRAASTRGQQDRPRRLQGTRTDRAPRRPRRPTPAADPGLTTKPKPARASLAGRDDPGRTAAGRTSWTIRVGETGRPPRS
jgi:SOS response associated peptidase (SRAP)